jgi:hypothetical protein
MYLFFEILRFESQTFHVSLHMDCWKVLLLYNKRYLWYLTMFKMRTLFYSCRFHVCRRYFSPTSSASVCDTLCELKHRITGSQASRGVVRLLSNVNIDMTHYTEKELRIKFRRYAVWSLWRKQNSEFHPILLRRRLDERSETNAMILV